MASSIKVNPSFRRIEKVTCSWENHKNGPLSRLGSPQDCAKKTQLIASRRRERRYSTGHQHPGLKHHQ
jgi:hypothetical protein